MSKPITEHETLVTDGVVVDSETENGHQNYYMVCGSFGDEHSENEVIAQFHGSDNPNIRLDFSTIGSYFRSDLSVSAVHDLRDALGEALVKIDQYESNLNKTIN